MAAKIEISLTDDGQIAVNGPIDNVVLALGMLQTAIGIVQARQQRPEDGAARPKIFTGAIVPRMNGLNRAG